MEPWARIWPDAGLLAVAHAQEVDGGIEPRRRFQLDTEMMALLDAAGRLKVLSARRDGQMVGYFTWMLESDIESKGLLVAQQGAWYVAPEHPGAAVALFDRSVEELRALGVQCIFPHHRLQGRGAKLGKFFERRGAVEIQHTYQLWIGDSHVAG